MARNNMGDRVRSRRGFKMEAKNRHRQQNKCKSEVNGSNVTDNNVVEDEPEVVIVPTSSSDEQEEVEDVAQVDEDEGEEEAEAKKSDLTNQRSNTKGVMKKKKKKKKEEDGEKKNDSALRCFPMHRINRIIKSDDSDIRIAQEAVFLINKASEKFLELFCKEAYACSFLERKNYVGYQHLSSVVCKRRRFDFLSDFVPEKVKAEDALAEISSAET